MSQTIAVLSTLDTKSEETLYLRGQIESRSKKVIVLDLGTKGDPGAIAEITRQEIFSLGANGEAAQADDRVKLGKIMTNGAIRKLKELYAQGKINGIIGIGGATNSLMETNVMRTLPFGFPKLMVSAVAGAHGLSSKYFGTSDITIMHSVIDFTGMNDLMRNVLDRAAGAITGMVENIGNNQTQGRSSNMIAMTIFGICENSATFIRNCLEENGYQVIGFSASGMADKAMEELITNQDLFRAVIDLAPGGVGEELFGGTRSAGPHRLEAAGQKGIPQIIAPCAVNLMSPARSKYKPDYYERKKYEVDALRTFLRLNREELLTVAQTMAQKLNMAKGPVKFLIPLQGWASVDVEGADIWDPESNRAFADELKKRVKKDIEVIEVDANIDEPAFAQAVVDAFNLTMESYKSEGDK